MKLKRLIQLILQIQLITAPFAFSSTASALTVTLSDQQLASLSDAVCHLTVRDMKTIETDDGRLITEVTADVHEWLKKPSGLDDSDTCRFFLRGGSLGDITQTVLGEGKLNIGQEAVVFLEFIPRYGSIPMLLGMAQGAFSIRRAPLTRSDRRIPVDVRRPLPRTLPPDHISSFESAEDLETLLSRIRAEIDRVRHD